ncbi:superfamily I DNA and RNA helicase [Agrobacterium tumefaciens CCNWGS0286]|nr:superfamily I DNA and RNA helicase [Agrobacterium tumefaciens CCNWGS0286]
MEIDHGLKTIIDQSLGGAEEQAINAVARGLGFKATSAQLRGIR